MKGILNVFEAIIAILTIFTAMIIFYGTSAQIPEFDTINWRIMGFGALKSLDDSNQLRKSVLLNDTTSIKNKLTGLISGDLNFDIVLCSVSCNALNVVADKVTTVSYFISGNVTTILPYQIVLYIWR